MSRFIDEHRGRFGVEPICRVLGVSASAYYQRATGQRSARAVEDERLLGRIRDLHAANYYAYGYRRCGRRCCARARARRAAACSDSCASTGSSGPSAAGGRGGPPGPTRGRTSAPIWCDATSLPQGRMSCGSPTCPTSGAGRACCSSPSSSTPTPAASSAGSSRRTCAPPSSSMPCGWRSASAASAPTSPWCITRSRKSRRIQSVVATLDREELRWGEATGGGSGWESRRCARRGVRRSGLSIVSGSGRRSRAGCRARMLRRRPACRRRSASVVSGGWRMPSVTPSPASGRYLSFAEREEIAVLRARGAGVRGIARRLGRSPSTISRELRRNAATRGGGLEYRATTAQWHADMRARRPKPAKLAVNPELRRYVQERLSGAVQRPDGITVDGPRVQWIGRRHGRRKDRRWARSWSPEQISHRLRLDFPDDQSMRVCHEAIYQSLYAQPRGALRRSRPACLRTGRALRVPRARVRGRGKSFVTDEVMISERPAQAEDRAVPRALAGCLILGLGNSAIGTLVERSSRFTMLLHLPPDGPPQPPPGQERSGADRSWSPGGPRRDRRRDLHAPRAASPVADLGPGRRDGPARAVADRHRP